MNKLFKPLTDGEIEEFDRLILKYANDDGLSIANFSEMDAFLTAILCSPTLIQTNQWIQRIWNFNDPTWDEEDAHHYMEYLFRLYNFTGTILRHSGEAFTAAFEEIALENEEIITIYENWIRVYLEGLDFVGIKHLPEEIQPELDLLREYHKEVSNFDYSPSNKEREIRARRIEIAVARIYKYINEEIYLPSLKQTYIREGHKIGVNEPCPCGSGKKYKKCCGKSH